ncbi:MAG: TolC family protein, partial [Pirellulales bacterium]
PLAPLTSHGVRRLPPVTAGLPVGDGLLRRAVSPTSWSEVAQASSRRGAELLPTSIAATPPNWIHDPLADRGELSLPALVEGVLAQNRSLQASIAAWRAAAERYPQAVALDDPMFMGMIGPASFNSDSVMPAYLVGGSQKLPWFGKRQLRGQKACFEARAASFDVGDTRLQLIQAARLAFYEYYLAQRQLELNQTNLAAVRAFREAAVSRYEQGQVTQQDILDSDVELAQLDRRQFELTANRGVAIARINTLLHRAPDFPLPPSPKQLARLAELPPPELLRQLAISNRPDLAAIVSRLYAEQTAVDLANKDYYPDVELVARYDAFWQEFPLRTMIGINANIPIYRKRLDSATREAAFRASQRRAEYEQRIDDINRDVQSLYDKLRASQGLVELYQRQTVPAAQQSVSAARAGYIAGKLDFLRLIESERRLIEIQDQQQDVLAGYHSLLAETERVVAGPLPSPATPEELPLKVRVE